jgi:hypothetical protein
MLCVAAKLPDRREYDATTKRTKATKDSEIILHFNFLLRALCRVLRGDPASLLAA